MITLQVYIKIKISISKHLRPNATFLLAPNMMGCVFPHHFSRVGSLVGRQTPIPNYHFNEQSIFHLAREVKLGVLKLETTLHVQMSRHLC